MAVKGMLQDLLKTGSNLIIIGMQYLRKQKTMTKNDKSLMKQMIEAGRFNYQIYELLIQHNKQRTKEMIKAMGAKWCCHPDNAVKRLDTPLPLLSRESKVLKHR